MRINKIFKSHMNDIECFHSTEVAKIVYLMVKQFEGVSMHPVSYHNNHKWTSFVWIAVICPQEGCLFATLLEVFTYIFMFFWLQIYNNIIFDRAMEAWRSIIARNSKYMSISQRFQTTFSTSEMNVSGCWSSHPESKLHF